MANEHLVFVYGTLRDEAKDPTEYTLSGYEMFSAGAFPYIRQGEGTIKGQLLVANDSDMKYLDKYEGVERGLYTRERVHVLKNGKADEALEVWAYVAGPLLNSPKIDSGDWVSYRYNRS